jgi:hypothetical protein
MKKSDLLTVSAQAVVFLFGMFGGVLKNIAPPDTVGAAYPVGIASFLALIVLLFITALASADPGRKLLRWWLIAAGVFFVLAVFACMVYPQLVDTHTYPPDRPIQKRNVNASDAYLTPAGRQFKAAHPGAGAEYMAENFDNDEEIWTTQGLDRAKQDLRLAYMWLVLSLAATIFCLLEANKQRVNAATRSPDPHPEPPRKP